MNIDDVETKLVFLDDAVNSAIAALPDGLPRVAQSTAIPHADKKFNDKALKECRRGGFNLVE